MYMLPLYSECAAYKLKELEVIQNRCIKALFRLPRLTPSMYLYSSGLLPLQEMVTVYRVMTIYKMVNGRIKHNFVFATNADVHGRSTRNCSHIHIFNPWTRKKNYNENSDTLIAAINEFNHFHPSLRTITSTKAYKDKLKLLVLKRSANRHEISPYFYIN